MVEFNPDGSLKLPGSVARQKEENRERMRKQRCLKIRRELVSFTAPKKCVLQLTLSDAITDNRFVETIYKEFCYNAKTPTKLKQLGNREFEIEIGTDFKRCSECTSLIGQYNEFLGNLIEEKGSCTFQGRVRSWSDEDYFE
jgi:hypothetical protein